ncbi:hypothetical protein ACA910_006656 [Epithemia clementina (nom. ined.)]
MAAQSLSSLPQQHRQKQLDCVPAIVKKAFCEIIFPRMNACSPKEDNHEQCNHETNNNQATTIVLMLGVSGGCDSVGLLHSLMEVVVLNSSNPNNRKQHSPLSLDGEMGKTASTFSNQMSPPLSSRWRLECGPSSGLSQQTCYSIHLHAVHFDHQQRGLESDGDRAFVQELCNHYCIPLTCWFWNQDHNDEDLVEFSQDTARKWRQQRMETLMRDLLLMLPHSPPSTDPTDIVAEDHQTKEARRVGVILTAHHQDDSMESLLLKLLRGVHITNLRGMEPIVRQQQQRRNIPIATSSSNSRKQEELNEKEVPNIWYARPFLSLSKDDIVDYLQQRGYSWREDSSNQSNKYLRNRVRNELIPLMSNLSGGKDVLYRRLDHMSRQSQEVEQYLDQQSRAYQPQGEEQHKQEQTTPTTADDAHAFELPAYLLASNGETKKSLLVLKHAIYNWAQGRASASGFGDAGFHFSYDQLQNVCHQLVAYPDNRLWRLSVGDGWDIVREGIVLHLMRTTKSCEHHHKNKSEIDEFDDVSSSQELKRIQWFLVKEQGKDVAGTNGSETNQHILDISIPSNWIEEIEHQQDTEAVEFLYTSANHSREALWFKAPWWPQERRPVRVHEFLRGQKVPLHRRRLAPIILLCRRNQRHDASSYSTDDATALVATYVETKGKWIVSRDFAVSSADQPAPNHRSIRLFLPRH